MANIAQPTWHQADKEQLARVAILDWMVNNTDRHGNF